MRQQYKITGTHKLGSVGHLSKVECSALWNGFLLRTLVLNPSQVSIGSWSIMKTTNCSNGLWKYLKLKGMPAPRGKKSQVCQNWTGLSFWTGLCGRSRTPIHLQLHNSLVWGMGWVISRCCLVLGCLSSSHPWGHCWPCPDTQWQLLPESHGCLGCRESVGLSR